MTAPASAPAVATHRTAGSPLSALADQCVQCGLCLPHCPTYQLDRSEPESPRGRIAYIKAVAENVLAPSEVGDYHLDHCLGCRRCESACPAGVRYGALLVAARAEQFQRRRPRLRLRLVNWLLMRPALLSKLLTLYRHAFAFMPAGWHLLPKPGHPPRPVPDPQTGPTVAVFLGCIARSYEASTLAALHRLLASVGLQATLPARQTCCGSAAEHLGDPDSLPALDADNRRAFAAHPQVLCMASGCQERLARSLSGSSQVLDPFEFLAERLPQLRFRPSQRRIALHLPCSQRSGPALKRLLSAIPGLTVHVLPDRGCCGAAGLHQLAEPERAAALREPLLQALAAFDVDEVLSANIGCRLHLAPAITLPVRHPLDFLAEHLP